MDYCVVTRSLKDQRLPSSLHSCIERITSLISLNNHFGTLIHAHGCFRLDYPPYHEQSEFLLSIYVIPRFSCKGRIFTSPKRLTILLVSFMHAECCTSINLSRQINIFPIGLVEVILTYVSWKTSYHEVRLAFHPFPQLIGELCNIHPFDPL